MTHFCELNRVLPFSENTSCIHSNRSRSHPKPFPARRLPGGCPFGLQPAAWAGKPINGRRLALGASPFLGNPLIDCHWFQETTRPSMTSMTPIPTLKRLGQICHIVGQTSLRTRRFPAEMWKSCSKPQRKKGSWPCVFSELKWPLGPQFPLDPGSFPPKTLSWVIRDPSRMGIASETVLVELPRMLSSQTRQTKTENFIAQSSFHMAYGMLQQ